MTNALRLPPHSAITHCTFTMHLDRVTPKGRRSVEQALVECLPSPSQLTDFATSPLFSEWFTQWRRTPGQRGTAECNQLLTGSPEEVECLRERLDELSRSYGFTVALTRGD